MNTMKLEAELEYADRRTRELSRADCQKIAAAYKAARAAGRVRKPMSLHMGRILNLAVSKDR